MQVLHEVIVEPTFETHVYVFRDRGFSTVLFIRNRYGNHGREHAPSRVSSVSARRGERSPFVTSVSVDEGGFNAESYKPSAERSLRISRCKARMRENEKHPGGCLKCASVTKLHAFQSAQTAFR